MKNLLIVLALLCLTIAPASADFYDGLRAYDQGDYPRAANEWKAAGKGGDANALFRLGNLNGTGVLQDFVKAHALYNVASSQGNKEAGKARNNLAEQMAKQELADARALAKTWPSWLEGVEQAQAAKAPSAPAGGVERFDGIWKWKATGGTSMCVVVFGPPTEIKGGKYRAGVTHGSDTGLASVSGSIDANGNVSGYGSGMYVAVYVKGKAIGDKAEGIAEVGGEASCTVEWAAKRIKK